MSQCERESECTAGGGKEETGREMTERKKQLSVNSVKTRYNHTSTHHN